MDIVEKIMKIAKPPRPEVLEEARYRKEHREELRAEAKRKLAEHRKKRLRVERKAIERYPITAENGERAFLARRYFVKGYEQGEKETIDRAAEWFRTHWREYILGPDADGCIGFGRWENDFRKAMEENNG